MALVRIPLEGFKKPYTLVAVRTRAWDRGIPDPPEHVVDQLNDRRIPHGYRVIATPILRRLHHEYRLEPKAA